MSTDLFRVRVTSIDRAAKTIGFTVFLVYYDWSGVPTDSSFFLRILWNEADTRFGGGGPLGDEVTVDQYLDEAWVDANTHRFVERVTRLAVRNDPPPADNKPPTFVYESFTDEDILTQGDYQVVVTDARWIEHLTIGHTWQTAACETKAKMPAGRSMVLADVKAANKARRQAWKAEREADVPTTLAEAIRRGDLDAIRTLVANRAALNPNHDRYGEFPLDAACEAVDAAATADSPAMRTVELLVELGADVNHRASASQPPVLFGAAYRGCDVLARWLVDHGASLEGTDHSDQHTVLHCAVNGGLTWLVERCLAGGVDPNGQTSQGHRVIHYAFATDAWQPIVEALVRAGADVTLQSSGWGTALHWAARYGRAAAVPWLVAHGIAVDTPSLGDDPETPLMVATGPRGGDRGPATIRALVELGADVHARTPVAGLTALHFAAQSSAEAVAALLAAGADRTVKTIGPSRRNSTRMKAGLLPIDMARRFKIAEAVKLLGTSTKATPAKLRASGTPKPKATPAKPRASAARKPKPKAKAKTRPAKPTPKKPAAKRRRR